MYKKGTGFHLFLEMAFAHVSRLAISCDWRAFLSFKHRGRFHISLPPVFLSGRWNKTPSAVTGGPTRKNTQRLPGARRCSAGCQGTCEARSRCKALLPVPSLNWSISKPKQPSTVNVSLQLMNLLKGDRRCQGVWFCLWLQKSSPAVPGQLVKSTDFSQGDLSPHPCLPFLLVLHCTNHHRYPASLERPRAVLMLWLQHEQCCWLLCNTVQMAQIYSAFNELCSVVISRCCTMV